MNVLPTTVKMNGGFAGIVVVFGIITLLALGFRTLHYFTEIHNRNLIEKLNRIEGFYGSEFAAWHNYIGSKSPNQKTPTGNTDSGGRYAVIIDNDSLTHGSHSMRTPYDPEALPGTAWKIGSTALFDPDGGNFRRYIKMEDTLENIRYYPPIASNGVEVYSGQMLFPKGKWSYKTVLSNRCYSSNPLPVTKSGLVEHFNWRAQPPRAAYGQVRTLVVGKLGRPVPSIVAPGFLSTSAFTGRLFALDGATGVEQWVGKTSSGSDLTIHGDVAPAIGDLDGDGSNEVVVRGRGPLAGLRNDIVYVLDKDGNYKWSSTATLGPPSNWGGGLPANASTGPSLSDVDGDGKADIVFGRLVLDAKAGLPVKFTLDPEDIPSQALDVRTDLGTEIITPYGIHRGTDGGLLCTFSPNIMHFAAARLRPSDPHHTVIGVGETWLGRLGAGQSRIVGFNANDCSKVFDTLLPKSLNCQDTFARQKGGGPINIADYDGDGELEFASGSFRWLSVFETVGTLKWKQPTYNCPRGDSGISSFDFNADGKYEIVYADHDFLRVFEDNGSSGTIVYELSNTNGTTTGYPVVADTDGDGHSEIITPSNNYCHANPDFCCSSNLNANCGDYCHCVTPAHKGVRVLRPRNNDWVGTRGIWNQYGYNFLNVGEDGKLVGLDRKSLWFPWVSSEHFSGFRTNIPQVNACAK